MGYMNMPCFAKTMCVSGGGQYEGLSGGESMAMLSGGGDGSMAFSGGGGSWAPPVIMPPRPPDGDSAVSMRTYDNCGGGLCCCCVRTLKVTYPKRFGGKKQVGNDDSKARGHYKNTFWVNIWLDFEKIGDGSEKCLCKLEWWEKKKYVNPKDRGKRTFLVGKDPKTGKFISVPRDPIGWVEKNDYLGGLTKWRYKTATLEPWRRKMLSVKKGDCPKSSKEPIKLQDNPRSDSSRTLQFVIIARSCTNALCKCKHKSLGVKGEHKIDVKDPKKGYLDFPSRTGKPSVKPPK